MKQMCCCFLKPLKHKVKTLQNSAERIENCAEHTVLKIEKSIQNPIRIQTYSNDLILSKSSNSQNEKENCHILL